MLNLLLQFALEVIRAVIMDELSERIRGQVIRLRTAGIARARARLALRMVKRHRTGFVHSLRTGTGGKP